MNVIRSLIFSVISVSWSLGAAPKPNILMILADDLGYSDLGCYGGEIATPNLDALAKNGIRFTQFYNTARCWPTRAALLTGYYAQQIHRDALPSVRGGVMGKRQSWAPLIPHDLAKAGYRSYHSGKWHIDGKVLEGGFEKSFNIVSPGNFFTTAGGYVNDIAVQPVQAGEEHYITITTADHAIQCLKDHAKSTPEQPFFQYIAFHAPHFPLHGLPQDIEKYRDRYLDGWDKMRAKRHQRQRDMGLVSTALSALEKDVGPPAPFPDFREKLGDGEILVPLEWSQLTDEQRRFQATKMAIHAAMVDRMDQEIGRIIAQLKSMNAFDHTLILFASDNGASAEVMVRDGGHDKTAAPGSAASYLCLGPGFSSACNTPFRRHKTWVHEGGISTPLIVHWPKGIKAKNELRHTPAHVIDLVPTIRALAGLEQDRKRNGEKFPPAPGKSLLSVFAKDQSIEREGLWWMHEGHRAARCGNWKIVSLRGQGWELYDLSKDRAEQYNLAASQPAILAKLVNFWQTQCDDFTKHAQGF
ncbi:MAG: arylsulfatase [Akkermansiaceae bacterium]